MASAGFVESLLGGLSNDLKKALKSIFEYVLKNLRFGRPEHQTIAENWQAVHLTGTTPGTANQEFSILHGIDGRAPYLLVPTLDLQAVNARIVPLKVTRAADVERIYLSSSETDAPVSVIVEG